MKRRDRAASLLLLDLKGFDAVAPLTEALRPRPDTEVMSWMQWPELWIEFADEHGDLQLAVPGVAERLIASWGLDDLNA